MSRRISLVRRVGLSPLFCFEQCIDFDFVELIRIILGILSNLEAVN